VIPKEEARQQIDYLLYQAGWDVPAILIMVLVRAFNGALRA
jgi:hypothetical protein